MNTLSTTVFILLILTLSMGAQAEAWVQTDAVDINIVDGRGQEFHQYPLRSRTGPGVHRAYLEAANGENYAIQVRNRSNRRVGLVIAVDGRNIISGGKSYLQPDERMYVLDPHQEATYQGWRTGRDQVNQFYFTDAGDSYAEAWGDNTAMGVIAVAVYQEQVDYPPLWQRRDDMARREQRSQRAPGALAEPGTGFGDEQWSPSRTVEFRPLRNPLAKYFIKYEWRETLCRKGIIRCHRPHPRRDNRFWQEPEEGFAPYPPGNR